MWPFPARPTLGIFGAFGVLLLAAGCQLSPDRGAETGDWVRMVCGQWRLDFREVPDGLRIRVDGRDYELKLVETASGSRYVSPESGETLFWSRGERARVELEGNELPECAYASGDLLSGPVWIVTGLGGHNVMTGYHATLRFTAGGRVSGRASCNHYKASWERIGDELVIRTPTTTRMACPSQVIEQERQFLEALARVERHDLSDSGNLLLTGDEGGVLIRARPREP